MTSSLPDELSVLPVGAEGAALLSRLHHAIVDASADGERAWKQDEFAALLRLPTGRAFVGVSIRSMGTRKERDPVGFAIANFAGGEGELLFLGVLPSCRRCGIGRLLLDAVTSCACEMGVEQVLLEVADDNIAARTLYGGAHFRAVGRRASYYPRSGKDKVDAIIMKRDI